MHSLHQPRDIAMTDKNALIANDGVWLVESVAERLGVDSVRGEQAHDLDEVAHRFSTSRRSEVYC